MQPQINSLQKSMQEIEPGYCQCGCGEKTRLAPETDRSKGWIKDTPLRFIHHHQNRGRRIRSIEECFWEKVNKRKPDECWEWNACLDSHGYGQMTIGGKHKIATRISWEINFGAIPEGLDVLHRCDNPICVNPNHLWLGTHADNMRDMLKKGRGRNWGHYYKK